MDREREDAPEGARGVAVHVVGRPHGVEAEDHGEVRGEHRGGEHADEPEITRAPREGPTYEHDDDARAMVSALAWYGSERKEKRGRGWGGMVRTRVCSGGAGACGRRGRARR